MKIQNIFSILEKRIIDIVLAIIFAIIVGIILVIGSNIYMTIIYGIGSIIVISFFGILIHKISIFREDNARMKDEESRIRDDLLRIRDENNIMRDKIKSFENKERELNKIEMIYNENITNFEGNIAIIRFDEPLLYAEASVPYLEFEYCMINRGVFDLNVVIRLIVEEYDNSYQLGENLSDRINIPHQSYGSTKLKIQPISQNFIDELSRKGNSTLRIKLKAHVIGYREFDIPSSNDFRLEHVTLLANDNIQNKLFRNFKEKVPIDDIRKFLPSATADRLDSIIYDLRDAEGNYIEPLFKENVDWSKKYGSYDRRRITDQEFLNLLGELSFIIDTYIKICILTLRNDKIKSRIDEPSKIKFKTLKEFYNTFGKNYNRFIDEINRKIPESECISNIRLILEEIME